MCNSSDKEKSIDDLPRCILSLFRDDTTKHNHPPALKDPNQRASLHNPQFGIPMRHLCVRIRTCMSRGPLRPRVKLVLHGGTSHDLGPTASLEGIRLHNIPLDEDSAALDFQNHGRIECICRYREKERGGGAAR
jgi:hypothetical protein